MPLCTISPNWLKKERIQSRIAVPLFTREVWSTFWDKWRKTWTFSNCSVLTKAIELLERPRLHFENLLSGNYHHRCSLSRILHFNISNSGVVSLFWSTFAMAHKTAGRTFICYQINASNREQPGLCIYKRIFLIEINLPRLIIRFWYYIYLSALLIDNNLLFQLVLIRFASIWVWISWLLSLNCSIRRVWANFLIQWEVLLSFRELSPGFVISFPSKGVKGKNCWTWAKNHY